MAAADVSFKRRRTFKFPILADYNKDSLWLYLKHPGTVRTTSLILLYRYLSANYFKNSNCIEATSSADIKLPP